MGMFKAAGYTLLGIVVVGGAIGLMTPSKPPPPPKSDAEVREDMARGAVVAAAIQLRSSMHDPKSFELVEALFMPDSSGCYEFRARNGFGAIRVANAVFDGQMIYSSEPRNAGFDKAWKAYCNGKTGSSVAALIRSRL